MAELKLKVSVIVCVYNEEPHLAASLRSVAKQTFPAEDYEIVIVDDGSTDSSPSICRDFVDACRGEAPAVRYVRISHAGLSCARNEGIKQSKGEILVFIDGDAEADAMWVEMLCRTLGDRSVGITGGRINLLNTDSRWAKALQLTRFAQVFDSRYYRNHFIGCNMAMSRESLSCVGGFHENFISRGDEVSFLTRAHAMGAYYAPSPDAIVRHVRPTSLLAWIRTEWREKRLSALVLKCAGIPRPRFRFLCRIIKNIVYLLFPVSVVASIWRPIIIPGLIPYAIILSLDIFWRPANRVVWQNVVAEYGHARGALLWACYCIFDACTALVGLCAGSVECLRVRPVPAFSTMPFVVQTLDTRQQQEALKFVS
jgi:glycosyltransferase involved in cell wall biosynthesis